MTAIGASCLWKSTISMDSDTIDDNDPLLTKERLGAVRGILESIKERESVWRQDIRS